MKHHKSIAIIMLVIISVSSFGLFYVNSNQTEPIIGILYDQNDYLSSQVAMDLARIMPSTSIVFFTNIENIGKVSHLFVIGHGSPTGISIGGNVSWAEISTAAVSSAEYVYMIACYSDNYVTKSILGSKLISSFDGVVDALVAEIISLAYFLGQIQSGYLANNVLSYLQFVFSNFLGEILSRSAHPKDPMMITNPGSSGYVPDFQYLLEKAIDAIIQFIALLVMYSIGICTLAFDVGISKDYEGTATLNGKNYNHVSVGVEASVSLECPGISPIDLFDQSITLADIYFRIGDTNEIIIQPSTSLDSSVNIKLFGYTFGFDYSLGVGARTEGYTYDGTYYTMRKLFLTVSTSLSSKQSFRVLWWTVASSNIDLNAWIKIAIDFLNAIKGEKSIHVDVTAGIKGSLKLSVGPLSASGSTDTSFTVASRDFNI